MAMVFISHDSPAARRHADEPGNRYSRNRWRCWIPADFLENPRHPYTQSLIARYQQVKVPRGNCTAVGITTHAAQNLPEIRV